MVDDPHGDNTPRTANGGAQSIVSLRNTFGANSGGADSTPSASSTMSDFEMMSKRVRHHRSISQLIENIGKIGYGNIFVEKAANEF